MTSYIIIYIHCIAMGITNLHVVWFSF